MSPIDKEYEKAFKSNYAHLTGPFEKNLKGAGLSFKVKIIEEKLHTAFIVYIKSSKKSMATIYIDMSQEINPEIVNKTISKLQVMIYKLAIKEFDRQLRLFT